MAAPRGYRLIVTMPERMSPERAALLRYFGAEVVTTPGTLMRDAVARAETLREEIPGAVMLGQFTNPANPEVHRRTTAEEIWNDTGGAVDIFVVGGGHRRHHHRAWARCSRRASRRVHMVAVEPAKAAVLSGGPVGNHLIQGIGAGFIPPILNRRMIDEVITVTEDETFACARRLAREEGILAASPAAPPWPRPWPWPPAPRRGPPHVTVLPDSGERYLSTPLFGELVRSR